MNDPKRTKTEAFLHGELSGKERDEVCDWIRDTPDQESVKGALRRYWEELPEYGNQAKSRQAFARFSQITGCGKSAQPLHSDRLWWNWIRNAAAVLTIPLLIASFFLLTHRTASDLEYCEFTVAAGHTDSLRLPDNSVVWLNSGSKLIYPKQFGKSTRQVFLSGEAYFEVAKEADRPFLLSAGEVQVRVLGTQFNVTSYEDMQSVAVSLIEGSVRMDVERNGISRNTLLEPGDVVQYDKITGQIVHNRVPTDAYCSWRNGGFYFNNQPLKEIVAQYERVFGTQIFVVGETLRETRYTLAFVNHESLDQMLRAIAATSNLTIREENDMIILSAKNRPMQQSN